MVLADSVVGNFLDDRQFNIFPAIIKDVCVAAVDGNLCSTVQCHVQGTLAARQKENVGDLFRFDPVVGSSDGHSTIMLRLEQLAYLTCLS